VGDLPSGCPERVVGDAERRGEAERGNGGGDRTCRSRSLSPEIRGVAGMGDVTDGYEGDLMGFGGGAIFPCVKSTDSCLLPVLRCPGRRSIVVRSFVVAVGGETFCGEAALEDPEGVDVDDRSDPFRCTAAPLVLAADGAASKLFRFSLALVILTILTWLTLTKTPRFSVVAK
jgi:hypothetical protein